MPPFLPVLSRFFAIFLSSSRKISTEGWVDEVLKSPKRAEAVLTLLTAGIMTRKVR
jgi:hypothetical protein